MPDLVSDDAAETTPEKVHLGLTRESQNRFVPKDAFHDGRDDGVERHLDDSAVVVAIEQNPCKRRIGPARELSDFTAECRDSERRTITTTVSGSVISKPVGGTVQVSRNPAVVQILATSALASSSVQGTRPATSIKWMRRA